MGDFWIALPSNPISHQHSHREKVFYLLISSLFMHIIPMSNSGGVKSKETRVCNSKGKYHSPIFSTRK